MKLSRKRRRELRHLRSEAQELLDQQLHVLGNANTVLKQAGKTARNLSDEYVVPRVDDAVERVRPTVDRGVASARRAGAAVRRVTTPLVASALANTIRALDELDSPQASAQVRHFGERTGVLKPAKKKSGVGGFIALGLGVAAAVGVGYALWQAFRTDDELWIAPDGN
ncbi:DNA/RNA helicase [Leucobacter denitrificans]|uniref:DNA/RNA helicase n=1 Tax=Leucobacter denitrificans TaxID=683042 RepID=A0A7G9S2U4_9MICO|nr:DNA/RNA helicase [Leucobacter denitrificans]QNN62169.1 DNA/RNA helicase [Leucobacter denitrificans]